MVEDALKLTRALHRLIIAVSGITLVFAFSVSLPEEKVRQRAAIEALLSANFTAYQEFVNSRIAAAAARQLIPVAEEVKRILADSNSAVINDFELIDHFRQPVHVGRILVEDLVLTDIGRATFNQLVLLNELSLERDVQVVLPRADMATEIAKFFDENASTFHLLNTWSISSIKIRLDTQYGLAQSFLPKTDNAFTIIDFELNATNNVGETHRFHTQFEADVVELKNTSFLSWLDTLPEIDSIAILENGQIYFGPELTNLTSGAREETLGEVAARLEREIALLAPDQQTASFLGTSVPGRLVLFAAPIILVTLQYYFVQHTRHLTRLVPNNIDTFKEFAWLPLSLQKNSTETWKVETGATVIAAPMLALSILFYQLSLFGDIALFAVLLLVGTGFATLLLGINSLRNIGTIRDQMELGR